MVAETGAAYPYAGDDPTGEFEAELACPAVGQNRGLRG